MTGRVRQKNSGEIAHRSISCTCDYPWTHECHELKMFTFPTKGTVQPQNTSTSPKLKDTNEETSSFTVKFFDEILKEFAKMKTFVETLAFSLKIKDRIHSFKICEFISSPYSRGLKQVLYPGSVWADGNCLPYTGRVHAFGLKKLNRIWIRIVTEWALHQDLYLDQNYFGRELDAVSNNLPTRLLCIQRPSYLDCS